MLKNFFLAAIIGLIICAGNLAEAEEIYIGSSPDTGRDCYVLTDTIYRTEEHRMTIYFVTMKTFDSFGDEIFIDYRFFDLDDDGEDVQFANSDGDKGIADDFNTPFEWKMFMTVKDY